MLRRKTATTNKPGKPAQTFCHFFLVCYSCIFHRLSKFYRFYTPRYMCLIIISKPVRLPRRSLRSFLAMTISKKYCHSERSERIPVSIELFCWMMISKHVKCFLSAKATIFREPSCPSWLKILSFWVQRKNLRDSGDMQMHDRYCVFANHQ